MKDLFDKLEDDLRVIQHNFDDVDLVYERIESARATFEQIKNCLPEGIL